MTAPCGLPTTLALPDDLPRPVDDGAADRVKGRRIEEVFLSRVSAGSEFGGDGGVARTEGAGERLRDEVAGTGGVCVFWDG